MFQNTCLVKLKTVLSINFTSLFKAVCINEKVLIPVIDCIHVLVCRKV